MKKLIKLTLLIVFVSCCTKAIAQKDYVINMHDDTLKCSISDFLFSNKKKYRVIGTSKTVKITVDSIKEYFIEHESIKYVARLVPGSDKPRYLMHIIEGRINLFEEYFITTSGTHSYTSIFYYASKGDEPLKEIKTNTISGGRSERKNAFSDLIADNEQIVNKYNEDNSFSIDKLKTCIRDYNIQYSNNKK